MFVSGFDKMHKTEKKKRGTEGAASESVSE